MGVLLLEPWDKVFYFQLVAALAKSSFYEPIIRFFRGRIEQNLGKWRDQIDGYDYIGYLRYPSESKDELTRAKAMQGSEPSVEGTIKNSTGISKWNHKRM